MHRRILLAEQSDASRGVAEAVLRQNGYEVISVSSAEKTFEVVQFTKPDLIIVGSDLTANGGKQLYDKIQTERRTAEIPLLLFCDASETSLPFPDEALIRRPLNPKDFLDKVTSRLSGKHPSVKVNENPLEGAQLEDEFLDAALGLDQIHVTDSEVMDKTVVGHRRKKKDSSEEKMIGLDHSSGTDTDQIKSGRVESLIVPEDSTDIVQKPQSTPAQVSTATGKIEIVSDQFGITEAGTDLQDGSGGPQDYDWFINEMKKEDIPQESPTAPSARADSGRLSITDPSNMVDPITPAPASLAKSASGGDKGGVEDFIEEFRKEVDKINDHMPESIVVHDDSSKTASSGDKLVWEEKIENLTGKQLGLFTKELAEQLADRLADKIASKIDSDKLLALLKSELFAHVRKND